jgi:hypothetical protein
MLGRANKCRVICRKGRKNPRLIQDGNRKMVTVIEGVSAGGVLLEPFIIHQGKVHIHDYYTYIDGMEPATFALSSKGWTNNELGFEYLTKLFDKQTTPM